MVADAADIPAAVRAAGSILALWCAAVAFRADLACGAVARAGTQEAFICARATLK